MIAFAEADGFVDSTPIQGMQSWMSNANHFNLERDGFVANPSQKCEEIEGSKEHCDGVRNFQGSWMQPIEADEYNMNFRFSPGMEGWSICYDAGFDLAEVEVK